jgi:hypothetical protein
MSRRYLFLAVVYVLLTTAYGATIFVPDNYPTIQSAVDAALPGDKVIVRPGTYVENVLFPNKAITLKSEEGADLTVIDGNQAGSTVRFELNTGHGSVLEGFTITNGSGTFWSSADFGGGVYCDQASPTITRCVIAGNTCDWGGGLFVNEGDPELTFCTIGDNHVVKYGGGGYCYRSTTTLRWCTIEGNDAALGGGFYSHYSATKIVDTLFDGNTTSGYSGAGLACGTDSTTMVANSIFIDNVATGQYAVGGGIRCYLCLPTIVNCTVVNNRASYEGGGIQCEFSNAVIMNTIVWGNSAWSDPELCAQQSSPYVAYCNVKGGWNGPGNIDSDPLLVDPGARDFHLYYTSPCRDAGTGIAPGLPADDPEGDPRSAYLQVDIGADEFYEHLYWRGSASPGAVFEIAVVGHPGALPGVGLGRGVLPSPVPTPFGDFFLRLPLTGFWTLPALPGSGILVSPVTLPGSAVPGTLLPFQAFLGPSGGRPARLTNLTAIRVE